MLPRRRWTRRWARGAAADGTAGASRGGQPSAAEGELTDTQPEVHRVRGAEQHRAHAKDARSAGISDFPALARGVRAKRDLANAVADQELVHDRAVPLFLEHFPENGVLADSHGIVERVLQEEICSAEPGARHRQFSSKAKEVRRAVRSY